MKKVFVKFVKGKKDERKESGGITPSQSGDLISPARTPEDDGYLGVDNSSGYVVDFLGKDKTLTKLHKAAWQGNLEKLRTALKKVEVDAVDRHNRTALHFAVAQGHPNIVWFLLGNNANTSVCDDEGHTPLLKAIECEHKECMNLLLDRGADVNVSDYTGNTGLHIAVGQASLDTVSALLKKGADTEISNNAGDYPLHIATRLENKDLVDLLLGAGASVDVLDRENRTPLMLAAKTGNCLLARLFVQHGAQSTVVDSNGWTAQDYAMLGGHENVAASLKSSHENGERSAEKEVEESGLALNDNSGSWEDSQTEKSGKEPIIQKFKKFYEKCSEEKENDVKSTEKNKNEESAESPDTEVIPPFCQPPRSWEMIQAGMIDENKSGSETKRRSITTLGTLRTRRESFTEGSVSSPEFTLSLNRRKNAKANNALAKQRFSFNEEESLKNWINEEKTCRREMEKFELENVLNIKGIKSPEKMETGAGSDWDSASAENPVVQSDSAGSDTIGSHEIGTRGSESEPSEQSGTLGREGTMQEIEEMWVSNARVSPSRSTEEQHRSSWDSEETPSEKGGTFPPPPSALELGVDMAKSIKYMKGTSVDHPLGPSSTNLWKNSYDSHSLDCLEERDFIEASRGRGVAAHGRHRSAPFRRGEEVFKCQKPKDHLADVSRRINEQLECYDQALRELAESSKKSDRVPFQNYHSLPSVKSGGGDPSRILSSTTSSLFLDSPHSLPFHSVRSDADNNERLGSEEPIGMPPDRTSAKNPGKKTKRHMLLAMREVKHAVHVANTFRTSTDDQILSPLTKPEESFDLDGKSSPKGFSSGSEGNSPPDENPFFGIGRQETVLERNDTERKSSSSETGEGSTLWLQDGGGKKKGARSPRSDDDVSEIAPDESSNHRRVSSFSPLGVIQKEMEEEGEEIREKKAQSAPGQTYEEFFCGENEEQNEETFREQSPDVSLSSGPIEPIGAEKDSGSEPESSHNDVSPTHDYALRSQHEWLKSHLKAATSEKNKLEKLTAQLAEKAERLQYELADAKEAAKSRDEVIRLLQGQLAKMEAAYTKSLEESVQSRLQLTSHEQEIFHLKELCYRYEEEKEAAGGTATGVGGDFLQELHLKIKVLEEEKEKMKKELSHLEEEKCLLEKRLKQDKNEESEMIDQCQRWKERCGKLEEMANAYDSKQAAYESYVREKDREFMDQKNRLQHQNFLLENKYLQLNEENIELRAKIQSLSAELEAEKRKTTAKDEKSESIFELKKKNIQMETHLKNLEKEMEERLVKKLKEKEEEVGGLVKQFNRERDSLVASYEKKLTEGRSEQSFLAADEWKKENHRLRQMVKNLQEQVERMQRNVSAEMNQPISKSESSRSENEWGPASVPVAEVQRDLKQLNALVMENLKLKKEINDLAGKVEKERTEGARRLKEWEPKENSQVKSEIFELKSQMNSLRMLLDGERWPSSDEQDHVRDPEEKLSQKSEGKRKGVGKEDELAWSSLYGMKTTGRKRGGRSTSVTETLIKAGDVEETPDEGKNEVKKLKPPEQNILNRLNAVAAQEAEISRKSQKLEFLQLKKEILSLQSKMSDEKNLRHALENQIVKMNLDLRERENLEKEMNCLKKKVDRDCLRRSEMELLEYQKDLDAKREKYLEELKEGHGDENFKAKCEILAKEREKSKELRNSFGRRAKSFDSPAPEVSPQLKLHTRPRPELFLHPRFVALDPDLKGKLEIELNKSIRKYVQESSSTPSISNLQIDFVKKNYF